MGRGGLSTLLKFASQRPISLSESQNGAAGRPYSRRVRLTFTIPAAAS